MENKPLISVIVPVYNTDVFLVKCLESIAAQTYDDLEIILVDDGSTDNSLSICRDFVEKDKRFKLIIKKNGGVSSARNKALEIASGEYIGFVDSDDEIEPQMFEIMHKNMIEKSADLSVCGQTQSGTGKRTTNFFDSVKVLERDETIKELLLNRAILGGPCNKLFLSKKIGDLRFDENIAMGEDFLFVIKYLLNCEDIVFDPLVLYKYNVREGSACTSFFNEKTFSDSISRERVLEEILKTEDETLIEYAHISILISDINLLRKLYYDKTARKTYCSRIQKSVRRNVKLNRLKELTFLQKLDVLLIFISEKLYFNYIALCLKIRGLLEKNG